MVFGCMSSPPNCSDLDRGRRPGDRESYKDLLKLSQFFNCIHDALVLTDKVLHTHSLGAELVKDTMEMVRIAARLTDEEFDAAPRMFTNINSTSPLIHDHSMHDGLMQLTHQGQPTIIRPFALAGTVAQSIVEALSALVLIQGINPGCPCGIGTFSSNVDMKTGALAFGTQHTQDCYKYAFYMPFLSDWSNFENWEDCGSIQSTQCVNKVWKAILTNFTRSPMDAGITAELTEFVARRKAEGGVPTDF